MRLRGVATMNTLLVAGLAMFGAAPRAQAAYTAYLYQDGANVVATGSGSIAITGTPYTPSPDTAFIIPNSGLFSVGSGSYDLYNPGISGPSTFGTGGSTSADSYSGSFVGIDSQLDQLGVPAGYVSGTSLGTSTATFDGTTLAALGVTPGTYTWTWPDGGDSLTLIIGTAPPSVPEPASIALLTAGLIGLGIARARAF